MAYWLIKSEPESFSLEDFRQENVTVWSGVRNYQARNNLKAMQLGDVCIFYRSVTKPAAIALCTVVKEHYPDPTCDPIDERWVAVDMQIGEELKQEISLASIKGHPELQEMALLKLSRLSVQPVTETEFQIIYRLGKQQP